MALYPDYTTLALLKAQVRVTDTADDVAFAAAITAASRAIDHECGRQFGVSTAVARTFTQDCEYYIDGSPAVPIFDLSSASGLIVAIDDGDAGTWPTALTIDTDYRLWPYNAVADGKPYTHLLTRSTSAYRWPHYPNAIKVTGLWGWAAVPAVVASACLIQAARFFVRRDSSYGIAGSPELGNELRLLNRLDPDVAVLLSSVKRFWGAA
jgi:hypothetical protein